MKMQQALNTILALIVGKVLAEQMDGWVAGMTQASLAQAEMALTVMIGSVASWMIEAGRAIALDATQGRLPRLYKLLGGTLVLLALTGCASATVSPEGEVRLTARGRSSAEVCIGEGATKVCSKAKGGTISQIFGDVLMAPIRVIGGALSGAAEAVAP